MGYLSLFRIGRAHACATPPSYPMGSFSSACSEPRRSPHGVRLFGLLLGHFSFFFFREEDEVLFSQASPNSSCVMPSSPNRFSNHVLGLRPFLHNISSQSAWRAARSCEMVGRDTPSSLASSALLLCLLRSRRATISRR